VSRLHVNRNYLPTNIVFGGVQILLIKTDNIMGGQNSKNFRSPFIRRDLTNILITAN